MQVLPKAIAVPWCKVCVKLDTKPVITYAGVELYNFKLLDPKGPWDLNNIALLHTFSGAMDEVGIAIEAAGAPALPAIVEALHCVKRREIGPLAIQLGVIADAIGVINGILLRMYEKNDPHIFFHRVRPYVNGWEKSEDVPSGVLYEGVAAEEVRFGEYVPNGAAEYDDVGGNRVLKGTYGKYAGASAGQSTLMHVLDVALGINHYSASQYEAIDADRPQSVESLLSSSPVGSPSPRTSQAGRPGSGVNIIHEMRKYMPGAHREFLAAVENSFSIRAFAKEALAEDPDNEAVQQLVREFNRCIDGLKSFRDKHIQIVSVYIIIPAHRKKNEVGHQGAPADIQSERIQKGLLARGTGGTSTSILCELF
ncbi:hypothetical protein HK101_005322 [Irineochytrium annulatum]|nr:hypothetical protein HK101_005322 [Irineochytrium annulatum]